MVKNRVKACFDGASRGNPGEAAWGAIIHNGEKVVTISEHLGVMTNNEAEYHGLIGVLEWALKHGVTDLHVFSDSQLVVGQMTGIYRVKAKNLFPLFFRATELRKSLPVFTISHIPRSENSEADKVVNMEIERNRLSEDKK